MDGSPATNQWYLELNKAPWTPPGWVFGAAWTIIMICYSVYLWLVEKPLEAQNKKKFYQLFALQWLLNVLWNPIFFKWHLAVIGAIVIIMLIIVLLLVHIFYSKKEFISYIFLIPYILWLFIALSLNMYAILMN